MRIAKIVKWALLGTVCIGAALLGLRAYRALSGPQLQPWHTFVPAELRAVDLDAADWTKYLEQEATIFASIRNEVSQVLEPDARVPINRYFEQSPVYPPRFAQDWNRSYLLEPDGKPVGAVVLLHGLTDSPYSLRHVAKLYRDHGYVAIGLRLPGHGTVPAGLTDVRWEDWMAATRLAVREVRRRVPAPAPLHLVGFSNGGALAMKYALDAIEDSTLPRADRIVLFTPMIGITRFARFAGLAGLPAILPPFANAAWLSVLPEFNPFKYNSFPVNGARQSYRLTDALQAQIQRLSRAGKLGGLPPVLTFQSVIDFTVSTPAILTALYDHLPDNGSEIVLFDVNRTVKFGPLLRPSSYVALEQLTPRTPQPYRFTAIVNAHEDSNATVERSIAPGQLAAVDRPLDLPYPPGIFSLSHLSIPIPMNDPLYGMHPDPQSRNEFGFNLGALDARGERGALVVDQDFLTRLPSNPFFPYVLERVAEGIEQPSGPTGRNIAATRSPGIPVRLEALLSTFAPEEPDSRRFSGP
ncbi:carboxylesterase [Accumulibacter sp.]|uniref:alpha/beta hydrolase n=1 Tax=Accumulibacter sp. TaxID=2053492 RepID=UPI0025F4B2C6|nr:alpha/beta hydrolase [Accumulibacter sp.]MCM8594022.1 alpha/beta hydrolase [Accumulibacter sp.]MDS4048164.1 alpha/beta hydrolase [Accumulibacter sp.]